MDTVESVVLQIRELQHEIGSDGDPDIRVAVLDGPVDVSHPCFRGASLTRVDTLVQEPGAAGAMSSHGTHVASVIFGSPTDGTLGISPGCQGLLLPVFQDRRGYLSQLDLARAIERAVLEGAKIINISGGEQAPRGAADPILERSLSLCENSNVLVVAAAGNDGCECVHVPAAVNPALAVGAMTRNGVPVESSNFGTEYRANGVLAPGENIPGAVPGGGITRLTGSSFAAPLVSGLAALLMTVQKRRSGSVNAQAIREAILDSAAPCISLDEAACERYLGGILNVRGAYGHITRGERKTVTEFDAGSNPLQPTSARPLAASGVTPSAAPSSEPPAGADGATHAGDVSGGQPAAEVTGPSAGPQPGQPAGEYAEQAPTPFGGQPQGQAPGFGAVTAPPDAAQSASATSPSSSTRVETRPSMGIPHYGGAPTTYQPAVDPHQPFAAPYQMPAPNQPVLTPQGWFAAGGVQQSGGAPAGEGGVCACGGQGRESASGVGRSCSCGVTPSQAPQPAAQTSNVYAIGNIGFDFGTEARRDTFRQLMPRVESTPPTSPPTWMAPNPYDVRQLANFLDRNPWDSTKVIWTVQHDVTPYYAIEAEVEYADAVYDLLRQALENQALPADDANYVSRVSIPGILTTRTVRLFSGQVLPVVRVQRRGLYIWNEEALVQAVIAAVRPEDQGADPDRVALKVRQMLDKVYYQLRNLGSSPMDRAINYLATNAFIFTDQIAQGLLSGSIVDGDTSSLYSLDTINAVKSPYCRPDSDCWDVQITFFDPDNERRARVALQTTIDVSDQMPVQLAPTHQFLYAA